MGVMSNLEAPSIKRSSILFLQIVIVLVGIGALALLLWEPQLEGRNANASFSQIYFNDPLLAYIYIASIAFFVALYQAFRLLGYAGRNEVFSPRSVKALRAIKHCALILIAFLVGAELYLNIVQRGREDDVAGGVMMGFLMIFVSVVVAAVAAVFERTLQSAVDIKSENEFTV
jgi:hypothetical protein